MNTKKEKSIIGIDARLYGPVGRGIGRYIKETVDGVLKLDKDHEYIIFLSGDNYDDFDDSSPHVEKVLVRARWYSLAEQFIMPFLVKKHGIDLIHFPHFNVPIFCTAPFIVTIHDLILTKFPTKRASTLSPLKYWIKDFLYKIVIKNAVKKAVKIIAVSHFTKKDIVEQFFVTPNKIEVIYEGVSNHLKGEGNDDNETILRYNINNPYLLYVGSAYPHKDLECLVDSFLKLNKRNADLQLVIIGRDDYFLKRLKRRTSKSENDNIIFPGFVLDDELSSFYKLASAYVFPSLYEGFGLPPLEAMYHGCPVVSSDQSCLPEILGDAAIYFKGGDNDNLTEKIEQILTDKKLKSLQIEKGYKQVRKYDWQKSTIKTLNIFSSHAGDKKKIKD